VSYSLSRVEGVRPSLCANTEMWAKGQPPALGAGHQVGSIPTISIEFLESSYTGTSDK